MSVGRWALRYLWLLTAPVTAFRGWQVSATAVSPVLDRLVVALMVSIFPVFVAVALAQARRTGTLKERIIMPWWCVAAFTLLAFPLLYGALSIEDGRNHGHSIFIAVLMMLMWTAPHVVALLGLTTLAWNEAGQPEPASVDIAVEDDMARVAVAAPIAPPGLPQYRPGTAPDNLRTDWQLGQDGLRPGGPAQGWLLLDYGPGMYLYDVDEARRR